MTPKELPSPELLRKLLRYEPDTGKLFWRERTPDMFKTEQERKRWNTRYSESEAMKCINANGYFYGTIRNTRYLSHRVIWAIMTGETSDFYIDHINGVRTDNRFKNLRSATILCNNRNMAKNSKNTSGFNGVHWCNVSRKWKVQIGVNDKRVYLGLYRDIGDAVIARSRAEAGLNFTERHGT